MESPLVVSSARILRSESNNTMKLVMMGTGPFAVPTFEALIESPHEVVALITKPPVGSHRKKRKDINPMRVSAEKFDLPIFDPPSVNDPDFLPTLQQLEADLFVVCDYGRILSRKVLSVAPLGGINLHGSLLPKYRGAAPINWALYHGDSCTGNTVIHMTPKLDGGPILETTELKIGPEDNAITVEEKLSQLGPAAVLRCIELLENWDGESKIGETQDQSQATKAPRLCKTDGQVDWTRAAVELVNQVRAFQPWPGTFSNLLRQSAGTPASTRLILTRVQCADENHSERNCGEVVFVDPQKMVIQTGDGQLQIDALQPSGKKSMPCADYLRGNPVEVGDRFE